MANVTYYVALPFTHDDEGNLVPGEALECQSSSQALSRAAGMAKQGAGAIAFARTGDPSLGEFEAAVVIATYGEVPSDLSEL